MSDNIIPINGETPPPPPPPPSSMNDLLDRAHNSWRFKRKDESIDYIIAGLRLMSQGVAQALKDIEELKKNDINKT